MPRRQRQCSYPKCASRAIYLATAPPPDRTVKQACIQHALVYRDVSGYLITRLDGEPMIDGELNHPPIRKPPKQV